MHGIKGCADILPSLEQVNKVAVGRHCCLQHIRLPGSYIQHIVQHPECSGMIVQSHSSPSTHSHRAVWSLPCMLAQETNTATHHSPVIILPWLTPTTPLTPHLTPFASQPHTLDMHASRLSHACFHHTLTGHHDLLADHSVAQEVGAQALLGGVLLAWTTRTHTRSGHGPKQAETLRRKHFCLCLEHGCKDLLRANTMRILLYGLTAPINHF